MKMTFLASVIQNFSGFSIFLCIPFLISLYPLLRTIEEHFGAFSRCVEFLLGFLDLINLEVLVKFFLLIYRLHLI